MPPLWGEEIKGIIYLFKSAFENPWHQRSNIRLRTTDYGLRTTDYGLDIQLAINQENTKLKADS